jgi:diguanylate cyclase (GGDEF)-like protein
MTPAVWLAFVLAIAAIVLTIRLRAARRSDRQLTALLDQRTAQLTEALDRVEQLATTDPLTGIANRRRFAEFLQREWKRALRSHTPITLVMVDVDFFKRFNDSHGHLAGDECLRRVAAALQTVARRPSDLAARYGGEEFAVVLSGTSQERALAIAESIRRSVEDLRVPHEASPVSPYVTVSVGVAVASPIDGGTPELLIFSADEALYRAKAEGRNCVACSWSTGVVAH